jgi:hypothetical protein
VVNVRGRDANTSICGTIREVHDVALAVRTLDEHDVLHVTLTLPFEFGLEKRLIERAHQSSRVLVQQREVGRVGTVGSTLMEEQQ